MRVCQFVGSVLGEGLVLVLGVGCTGKLELFNSTVHNQGNYEDLQVWRDELFLSFIAARSL